MLLPNLGFPGSNQDEDVLVAFDVNRVIFDVEEEKDGMVILDCRPGDGQEVKRRGGGGRDPRGFQSF